VAKSGPTNRGLATPTPRITRSADRPKRPPGPPPGTRGIERRYLETYGARRVNWDDVLDRGRPLPAASAQCRRSWRNTAKDRQIDWSKASVRCMTALSGLAYRPQGIAGSATAKNYLINGWPASDRDIILTSWYCAPPSRGCLPPTVAGA
jgi:hypothetical protein